MGLRADVLANNFVIMRRNLYEEASLGLPTQIGVKTTRTVKKGTIVARTVDGGSHYQDDIDSLARFVSNDLASAEKFPVEVTTVTSSDGVKFTFQS